MENTTVGRGRVWSESHVEYVQDPGEIVVGVELDLDLAGVLGPAAYGDLGAEDGAQVPLGGLVVRAAMGGPGAAAVGSGTAAGGFLGLAHGQAVRDDTAVKGALGGGRGEAEDRHGVAARDPAGRQSVEDLGGQGKQAHGIGDGRAVAADGAGDLLLGHAELVGQAAVGARLLDRVEVFALDVLDEGELEHVGVVDVADDGRNGLQARLARGPQTPLAGDEFEASPLLPHDDRLHDPLGADGRHKLGELALVEVPARLVGVDGYLLDVDLTDLADVVRRRRDQDLESLAQGLLLHVRSLPLPGRGTRPRRVLWDRRRLSAFRTPAPRRGGRCGV